MANMIIDVETKDVNKLMRKLKRLKSTSVVENGGKYWQDTNYTQVWLESTKTVDEVEDWLYKFSNCEYIGVVER